MEFVNGKDDDIPYLNIYEMEKNPNVPNHQPDTSDTAIKSPINSPSNGSVSKPMLYPFCSHQNSWDLWMFIPLKMVFS